MTQEHVELWEKMAAKYERLAKEHRADYFAKGKRPADWAAFKDYEYQGIRARQAAQSYRAKA